MPKWEAEARDRVRTAVRCFAKPLADLIARDANEGDTRLLATDFLCEGLGYDKTCQPGTALRQIGCLSTRVVCSARGWLRVVRADGLVGVQLKAKPGRVDHIQRPAQVSLAWAGVLGPEFG